MKTGKTAAPAANRRKSRAAFTLLEVVIATAVAALILAGLFSGYNMVGYQAQYAACNLAANTVAMTQMEQAVTAEWIPSGGINQWLSMPNYTLNYNSSGYFVFTATNTGNLCLPSAQASVVNCTNYTTVTELSLMPPYVEIKVQCVWSLTTHGPFTNTVYTLRAANL